MTEKALQDLIEKYRVPLHIRAHMEKVAGVALFLARKLIAQGEKVDLHNLRQASLLHDILKLCDFKELRLEYFTQTYSQEDVHFWTELIKSCSHKGHIQAAYELLIGLDEPELAEIVKKHRFNCLIEESEKPVTWEEKLLYYADKRVMHDKVVSIKERLEDGRKRYFPDGKVPVDDSLVEKALFELEQEICGRAEIKPDELLIFNY
jgi:uncharacterized protein